MSNEENQPVITQQTLAQNEAVENVLKRFKEARSKSLHTSEMQISGTRSRRACSSSPSSIGSQFLRSTSPPMKRIRRSTTSSMVSSDLPHYRPSTTTTSLYARATTAPTTGTVRTTLVRNTTNSQTFGRRRSDATT